MKKKLFFAQPAVDQDLGVVLDGVREDPEGPGGELLLLLRLALLRSHVCFAGHPDQWHYLSETRYMWIFLVYIGGYVCLRVQQSQIQLRS